jgi:hypothetical protein
MLLDVLWKFEILEHLWLSYDLDKRSDCNELDFEQFQIHHLSDISFHIRQYSRSHDKTHRSTVDFRSFWLWNSVEILNRIDSVIVAVNLLYPSDSCWFCHDFREDRWDNLILIEINNTNILRLSTVWWISIGIQDYFKMRKWNVRSKELKLNLNVKSIWKEQQILVDWEEIYF